MGNHAMKAVLLMMREETQKIINDSLKSSSQISLNGDMYDQASSDRDRELMLLLGSREREKLRNINGALLRLEQGEYGICEECEEEIPLGRLKILPFARYCVKCKTDVEREQAQIHRVEESFAYGDMPLELVDAPYLS